MTLQVITSYTPYSLIVPAAREQERAHAWHPLASSVSSAELWAQLVARPGLSADIFHHRSARPRLDRCLRQACHVVIVTTNHDERQHIM